jgi:hypothetical protein
MFRRGWIKINPRGIERKKIFRAGSKKAILTVLFIRHDFQLRHRTATVKPLRQEPNRIRRRAVRAMHALKE